MYDMIILLVKHSSIFRINGNIQTIREIFFELKDFKFNLCFNHFVCIFSFFFF